MNKKTSSCWSAHASVSSDKSVQSICQLQLAHPSCNRTEIYRLGAVARKRAFFDTHAERAHITFTPLKPFGWQVKRRWKIYIAEIESATPRARICRSQAKVTACHASSNNMHEMHFSHRKLIFANGYLCLFGANNTRLFTHMRRAKPLGQKLACGITFTPSSANAAFYMDIFQLNISWVFVIINRFVKYSYINLKRFLLIFCPSENQYCDK